MRWQAWNLDCNSNLICLECLFYLTSCSITEIMTGQTITHHVLQCWRLWSTPKTLSIHFLWFPVGLSECGAAGAPWCGVYLWHARCCGGWWKAPPCLHWTASKSTGWKNKTVFSIKMWLNLSADMNISTMFLYFTYKEVNVTKLNYINGN